MALYDLIWFDRDNDGIIIGDSWTYPAVVSHVAGKFPN
jgi:hypothetical protein